MAPTIAYLTYLTLPYLSYPRQAEAEAEAEEEAEAV